MEVRLDDYNITSECRALWGEIERAHVAEIEI